LGYECDHKVRPSVAGVPRQQQAGGYEQQRHTRGQHHCRPPPQGDRQRAPADRPVAGLVCDIFDDFPHEMQQRRQYPGHEAGGRNAQRERAVERRRARDDSHRHIAEERPGFEERRVGKHDGKGGKGGKE